jgi:signal transduction histidine kinase
MRAAPYSQRSPSSGAAERARVVAILEGVSDAVLVVDAGGQHLFGNAAFYELVASGSKQLEQLSARAARGECVSEELIIGTKAGERRFEARVKPVLIADGCASGGIVALTERTARRQLQLHEEFMAIASHELRSPLTALGGFMDMLARQLAPQLDERAADHLTRARAQIRRLGDLVDELTDLARLHRGPLSLRMARVDIVALLDQIVATMQTLSTTHTVCVTAPRAPVWVPGDASRLEQVLMNLVGNAVKYAPDSDRIDVEVRTVDGQALVSVRDYGPGIADGDREQIFQRYYQAARRERSPARGGGLGLGLHIAREIMLAHGGDVELTETSRDGTIFTARLPLASN